MVAQGCLSRSRIGSLCLLVAILALCGPTPVQGLKLKADETKTPLDTTFHHNLHVIEDTDFEETIIPRKTYLVTFVKHDLLDDIQAALLESVATVSQAYWKEKISFVVCLVHVGSNAAAESAASGSPSLEQRYLNGSVGYQFVLFPAQKEDRTCLLTPPPARSAGLYFKEVQTGEKLAQQLVDFINFHGKFFQMLDGSLTPKGATLRRMEKSVYSPREPGFCDVVSTIPTRQEFFNDYLSKSRPVIFKGAISHWPALSKWTNEFLRKEIGTKPVHVKITPDGDFEGCDEAKHWAEFESRVLPERVLSKLEFPELVVVRPSPHDIPFNEFMDIIEKRTDINAYLEYASMATYLPSLLGDVEQLPFVKDLLKQAHFNVWLGNGRTLGKLHFDPFDNLLCQVAGEKHLTLFPPSQSMNLYEGHIPEAQYDYSFESNTFSKTTLLESTSMVMSPVDIKKPDLERFPFYGGASALKCGIEAGDVLFLPSFWWHEVQSQPDTHSKNIAVNYWFDPFFTKEFPCPRCSLHVSEDYEHLLALLSGSASKDSSKASRARPAPSPPPPTREVDEL